MIPLADWEIWHGDRKHTIGLYWGDLSYLPPAHEVDILVVSAFPNDYMPTPTSLIGALDRNGISVEKLSFAKEKDMRNEFSCWLSERLVGVRSFGRILCIESGWRGTPPEIADDLFRAIAPLSVSEFPQQSIAMPLIGTGDQGYPAEQMMESVLRAAITWLRRGLPITSLKIVAYSDKDAEAARKKFLEIKRADSAVASRKAVPLRAREDDAPEVAPRYDVFLSYSHRDSQPAQHIDHLLRRSNPGLRVFLDKSALVPGASWLMQVAESLDASRRVVVLHTPDYWQSTYCKDEFAAAYVRQADTGQRILFPIHFKDTQIPYLFRTIEYADCRDADLSKLSDACQKL